jgi:hypothetical protein
MAEEDMSKMAFRCPGFIGLFEWVVMTFGLKNAGTTYQRAYIEDVVVQSESIDTHLADLRLALESACQYGLKMKPLKCGFGVLAGRSLGFIIHDHGIEIDPTKIESINKVQPPQCKNHKQKFLGKLNYLRQFIFNLSGKISAFAPILRLNNEPEFTWGACQHRAFDDIKKYLSSPPMMKAPMVGIPFRLSVTAEDAMIGAVLTQVTGGMNTPLHT